MWVVVIVTVGSCVTVPHIGWMGWLGVWFLWKLASQTEEQEARIQELEARLSPNDYDDYSYDRPAPRRTDAGDSSALPTRRSGGSSATAEDTRTCNSCWRELRAGDRFCPQCGAAASE